MNTAFDPKNVAYAYGQPSLQGTIRSRPEDFQVDEILGFELSGAGEHVCLHLRKRGLNTVDVARQIAQLAGVRQRDVSYAGLKDKYALTSQWFSIYLSNKPEPDWSQLNSAALELLKVSRHSRKLRRGALQGNHFTLVVRQLAGDLKQLQLRLEQIACAGVPNYFGEQRFGHNNLARAMAMFERQIKVRQRDKRSIYLSAARSSLFNYVLSARVESGTWNQAVAGDVMMLAGSRSVFFPDEIDAAIQQRVANYDIHPTGPLWGRGDISSVAQLNQAFPVFCQGLEQAGMKLERRSLRLLPQALTWAVDATKLKLSFSLPPGTYATSVLREVCCYTASTESSPPQSQYP